MALEIEDGTGKPDADSYATAAELTARATAYGWTLPEGEPAREVLLRRAFEAMKVLRWLGRRVSAVQAGAFPRSGIPGVASDEIPAGVKNGQMALAAEIHADDMDPPETRTGAVTREKVDVLEVSYAETSATAKRRAAPERSSEIQFADYLLRRGLFIPAVRA